MSKTVIDPLPDELAGPELKAQAMDFQFHWVNEAGPSKHSDLTSGISLRATVSQIQEKTTDIHWANDNGKDSFESCPPLDIVLVGASHVGYQPTEAELAYARKAYDECSAFLSICAGVDVPARIGALDGKTATCPAIMIDMFRQAYPTTDWVTKRWARDGKAWTSGTLLNGTDMMVAFVSEMWGREKGEASLVECNVRLGGWPVRDVDFKDDQWVS